MRVRAIGDRMESFTEYAIIGALFPLVIVALVLLSPMALLGWVVAKWQEESTPPSPPPAEGAE